MAAIIWRSCRARRKPGERANLSRAKISTRPLDLEARGLETFSARLVAKKSC